LNWGQRLLYVRAAIKDSLSLWRKADSGGLFSTIASEFASSKDYNTDNFDVIRSHIMNDLQPGVCLHAKCDRPWETFTTTAKWAQHMAQHTMKWHCYAPSHGKVSLSFDSEKEFAIHLQTEHGHTFASSQLSLLCRIARRPSLYVISSCPFCFQLPSNDLMSHIFVHLEEIAFHSIPLDDTNDVDIDSSHVLLSQSSSRNTLSQSLEFDESEILFIDHEHTNQGDPTPPGNSEIEAWHARNATLKADFKSDPEWIQSWLDGIPAFRDE
jgi:hypothetical protein